MVYGESTSDPINNNLNGKLYKAYDGVGCKTIATYDFKGNPLTLQQQVLADGTIIDVDWSSAPSLDPEVFSTTISYDALSRPITSTDAGGNVTRHVYDDGGMLYSIFLTPPGLAESTYVDSISYDAKGQRQEIEYGNGTTTFYTYDPDTFRIIRLLTTKSGNKYQDLNYWYDPIGNVTILQDASKRCLFFSNSIILPEQNYTYDALYRLIIANGRELISLATFGINDNYNDAPWMGVSQPGNDSQCQNYIQKYAYDEVGNILTLQHIADSGSFTRNYNYGVSNNRLLSTVIGSYPPPKPTYNYSYDLRGNIIAMPHLSAITFNADNYMSTSDLGGGGNAYYQYSDGQRGRKTIVNGAIKEERIYFGSYEIYRKYISGVLQIERTTVHISDDTGRIAMLERLVVGDDGSASSLVRYVYSNNTSTATLELDDTGAIISYEEYHPYGTTSYQAMNADINATAKRYRFTGKERDEENGFYYIGARYYAPWLTRWMACDPINSELYNIVHGEPQRSTERQFIELTASSYEYCYANPIRFTDPTGEQAVTPPPQEVQPAPPPDPDKKTIFNKYGVIPYQWDDDLSDKPNDAPVVINTFTEMAKKGRLSATQLYTISIGEGLNAFYLKFDNPNKEISGFESLGTDHFYSDAASLKKGGYLPSDFNEGNQYSLDENVNEKSQNVKSAIFKNLESGLIAFSAIAQERADVAVKAGIKLNYGNKITEDQLMFWTYVFFQSPNGQGPKLLKQAGSWDYTSLKFNKNDRNPPDIKSKAFLRMATSEFIKLKGPDLKSQLGIK